MGRPLPGRGAGPAALTGTRFFPQDACRCRPAGGTAHHRHQDTGGFGVLPGQGPASTSRAHLSFACPPRLSECIIFLKRDQPGELGGEQGTKPGPSGPHALSGRQRSRLSWGGASAPPAGGDGHLSSRFCTVADQNGTRVCVPDAPPELLRPRIVLRKRRVSQGRRLRAQAALLSSPRPAPASHLSVCPDRRVRDSCILFPAAGPRVAPGPCAGWKPVPGGGQRAPEPRRAATARSAGGGGG